MIALGFRDVQVQIETDTLFTVIGTIDTDRRRNWETQLQAMRPHLIQLLGSEFSADRFVKRFLNHYDDPTTCSYTSLYFTRGRV